MICSFLNSLVLCVKAVSYQLNFINAALDKTKNHKQSVKSNNTYSKTLHLLMNKVMSGT